MTAYVCFLSLTSEVCGPDPVPEPTHSGARPRTGTRHHAQHRRATCNTVTRELFALRFAAMVRTSDQPVTT